MSGDEAQRRDRHQKPFSGGSDEKSPPRSKQGKGAREVRQDTAVEIVDRLEQALRNLFR